jgi:hypothetical protein
VAQVVGLGFENMQVQSNDGTYHEAQVWNFYNGGYSRTARASREIR